MHQARSAVPPWLRSGRAGPPTPCVRVQLPPYRYAAPDNGGDAGTAYLAGRAGTFGAQLPEPFGVRAAPGSHHTPARSTTRVNAYSFRSSQITLFTLAALYQGGQKVSRSGPCRSQGTPYVGREHLELSDQPSHVRHNVQIVVPPLTNKNARSILYVRDHGRAAACQGPGKHEGMETSRTPFRGIRVRSRSPPP